MADDAGRWTASRDSLNAIQRISSWDWEGAISSMGDSGAVSVGVLCADSGLSRPTEPAPCAAEREGCSGGASGTSTSSRKARDSAEGFGGKLVGGGICFRQGALVRYGPSWHDCLAYAFIGAHSRRPAGCDSRSARWQGSTSRWYQRYRLAPVLAALRFWFSPALASIPAGMYVATVEISQG